MRVPCAFMQQIHSHIDKSDTCAHTLSAVCRGLASRRPLYRFSLCSLLLITNMYFCLSVSLFILGLASVSCRYTLMPSTRSASSETRRSMDWHQEDNIQGNPLITLIYKDIL